MKRSFTKVFRSLVVLGLLSFVIFPRSIIYADTLTPTPTDTPVPTLTSTPSPTDISQQSPTPTPVCDSTAPSGTPQLISANPSGSNQIILTWTAVNPVSYYLISYGLSSGNYIYGNPNVGNVTSYTVGGLSYGKTYYFAVKAVNGCSTGNFSNELSSKAGGIPTLIPTVDTSIDNVSTTSNQSGNNDNISPTNVPTDIPTSTPTVVRTMGLNTNLIVLIFTVIGFVLLVIGLMWIRKENLRKKPLSKSR